MQPQGRIHYWVANKTCVVRCSDVASRQQKSRRLSIQNTYLASHGPKSSNGTVVISLKSKQPPHTKRLTVTSLLIFLISGRYSSTTLAIASRLSDVALSPSYLQRHSRQTRLKDMAPFASGTSANAVDARLAGMAGAKACQWVERVRQLLHFANTPEKGISGRLTY
jgi:hypothetical protein